MVDLFVGDHHSEIQLFFYLREYGPLGDVERAVDAGLGGVPEDVQEGWTGEAKDPFSSGAVDLTVVDEVLLPGT